MRMNQRRREILDLWDPQAGGISAAEGGGLAAELRSASGVNVGEEQRTDLSMRRV